MQSKILKPSRWWLFGALLAAANLFVCVAAFAQPQASVPAEEFARGNQAFAEGRYADAVAAFEEFAAHHGESPAALLNLGNAYFESGDHGRAIAAYERGLVLAPRDFDLRANLETARHGAGIAAEAPWQAAAGWLSLGEWSTLLVGAGVASGLLLLLRGRRRWRAGITSALALAVVAGGGLWLRAPALDRAIVVGDEPALLLSPVVGADAVGGLVPGTAVQIEKAHGEFRLVRGEQGRKGWVARAALAPLYGG